MQLYHLIQARPALRNLKELMISSTSFKKLPPVSVRSGANLTLLDLNGSGFTAIPPAISELTKLRTVDLTGNPVWISSQDAVTLDALPQLRNLYLDMEERTDLPNLIAIARRFPYLEFEKKDLDD